MEEAGIVGPAKKGAKQRNVLNSKAAQADAASD
jgi:hypothetical protein